MSGLEALIVPLITAGASAGAAALTAPKAPKPQAAAALPKPDDALEKQKRLEEQQRLAATKGRDSTNLTGNAAPSYSNTTLGG
jgi:hypothetical protein